MFNFTHFHKWSSSRHRHYHSFVFRRTGQTTGQRYRGCRQTGPSTDCLLDRIQEPQHCPPLPNLPSIFYCRYRVELFYSTGEYFGLRSGTRNYLHTAGRCRSSGPEQTCGWRQPKAQQTAAVCAPTFPSFLLKMRERRKSYCFQRDFCGKLN